jgi:uncharacterized protein YndB with AHSA1/START domain
MHDIVHELTIAAPPPQVFDAITTVAGLAGWWSDDVSTSAEATVAEGAEITIGLGEDRTVVHLRIDTLDPPLLAHLTCLDGPEEWAGTELAFRVESDDQGGSVLRFWHGGWEYEDGALPRCSFEWAMDLARLRDACESGPVSA